MNYFVFAVCDLCHHHKGDDSSLHITTKKRACILNVATILWLHNWSVTFCQLQVAPHHIIQRHKPEDTSAVPPAPFSRFRHCHLKLLINSLTSICCSPPAVYRSSILCHPTPISVQFWCSCLTQFSTCVTEYGKHCSGFPEVCRKPLAPCLRLSPGVHTRTCFHPRLCLENSGSWPVLIFFLQPHFNQPCFVVCHHSQGETLCSFFFLKTPLPERHGQ